MDRCVFLTKNVLEELNHTADTKHTVLTHGVRDNYLYKEVVLDPHRSGTHQQAAKRPFIPGVQKTSDRMAYDMSESLLIQEPQR